MYFNTPYLLYVILVVQSLLYFQPFIYTLLQLPMLFSNFQLMCIPSGVDAS